MPDEYERPVVQVGTEETATNFFILPKSKLPLHFPIKSSEDNFVLSVGNDNGFSVPLFLAKPGYFQVGFKANKLGDIAHVNVEIGLHGQVTYVVLSHPDSALFQFHNDTPYNVEIESASRRTKNVEKIPAHRKANWYFLSPQSTLEIQFKVVFKYSR